MKKHIIKLGVVAVALLALVLLVGDMPGASMAHFAAVKFIGLALLWGAVKVWEATIPEENI